MLYVVLPCYNEEENIKGIIKEWKAEEEKLYSRNISLKLVIVNDGSKDNTLNIAKELESNYKNLVILDHKVNQGLGEALNTGINYVVSQRDNGLLCIMDADLTHQPHYIYSMLDKLKKEELQCVIASRYRKGSKVEGLSFLRILLSYGARVVYTLTLRVPKVRDYTCGYRLYKVNVLEALFEKYDGKIVKERSFACMMELLYKLSIEGCKIGEVPFVLKYQLKGGQSKMRIFKTVWRSLLTINKLK